MLLEKLDFDQLKKMALALNTAMYKGEEGKEVLFLKMKLKTIAISKENLAKNFDTAIKSIPNEVVNELPDDIIDFYNEFFAEPDEPAEHTEPEPVAKAEEAPKEKKEKVEKAPKEKKEESPKEKKEKVEKATKEKKVAELSVFGHKLGSQSAILDDLLNTDVGISLEKLSEKSGRSPLGVKSHIKHLRTDRGLKIDEKEGVYILVK